MGLGRQGDPHGKYNMPPGVMEHFETATRDPAFFRLHKYMDNIFKEHKDSLPPYTHDELMYDNVEITKLDIEGDLSLSSITTNSICQWVWMEMKTLQMSKLLLKFQE